jgi:hypothetical protein
VPAKGRRDAGVYLLDLRVTIAIASSTARFIDTLRALPVPAMSYAVP